MCQLYCHSRSNLTFDYTTYITGEYLQLTRVTPIVKSLNLETLEDRRAKSKVVIIHKALNSNLEIQHNNNLLK